MQRRMKGKNERRRESKESGETETRDKTRERRREQWAVMALFIRCVHAQLLDAHPQEWLGLAFFTPFQF
jgi:hypothetical protein